MYRSQIEVSQEVLNFLGDTKINTAQDLLKLKNKILKSLKFLPYNNKTKKTADNLQWKRTAAEIIEDNYVYSGKACSDIAVVFLALCRAAGHEGKLVKLISATKTHSIVEINLQGKWWRIDPSSSDALPVAGKLTKKSIWNKDYRVWKKGRDVWDIGLDDISMESRVK